ncbi:hypothetical protein DUI87_06548 [Hirundo rustica rustica]|uniref:Uncharacterized protein n=1 Tax=Hirundo rustica rustica TaxID=333673 RepID=A0A3M0KV87_HIRRU|nr:hypothetical protein DUI87_06548 [Hirundo rustica rustica]
MDRKEQFEILQGQMQGPAPGEEQPWVPAQAGAQSAGKPLCGEELGVLVDSELSVSQQCPGEQEGQWNPGVLLEEHCQWVKGGDPALLLSSTQVSPGVCAQFWSLEHNRDMDLLEWVHQRTAKVMKVLEHFCYEERLRESASRKDN